MKNSSRSFVSVGCTILLGVVITQNQIAFAGWTGGINGNGVGWASVNVSSSTLRTNRITTANNLSSPSAAMAPAANYKVTGSLPEGASVATYSRIRGLFGGIWSATNNAANGDGADNRELQERITITPADCAFLSFDSKIDQNQSQFNANGNNGTISVNAKATAGAALWLRLFQYLGSMDTVPSDNPDTVQNESIEYLKANGVLKSETLMLGPFEFGGTNDSCPLIVPFSLASSNLEHLVIATDGVALSLPLVIYCPQDVVTNCTSSFSYPPLQYAGCGDITITYSHPAPPNGVFQAGAFDVGTTTVTATATDTHGNSKSCTFTVTITDTTPPVPNAATLPVVTGTCSTPLVVTPPTATDNCAGQVVGKPTPAFPITAPGTTVVTWTFSDGNGNTSKQYQTVNNPGLRFQGFYSPVGTVNNTISTPVTRTAGASFPLKWDMFCGTTLITTGTPPTVVIQKVSPALADPVTLNAEYQNDWHINWPTPNATKNDIYKATVNLPDGSKAVLFVKFK